MYDVKVYQKGCGELIVAEVDIEYSADPDTSLDEDDVSTIKRIPETSH